MLPDRMVWGGRPDCPLCSATAARGQAGGVDTYSGNATHHESDLTMPTAGSNLSFQRSYSSQRAQAEQNPQLLSSQNLSSSIGNGWVHNYEIKLDLSQSGVVELQTPSGSRLPFTAVPNGNGVDLVPYAGVTAELVKNGNGSYTLTAFEQSTYHFNAQGQLTSLVHPNGSAITFTYNANGLLDRAQQGGRYQQYSYNGAGRLTAVSNANGTQQGNTTTFSYDSEGNLIGVTSPAQVKTYTYQNGTPLLTSITDGTNRTLKQINYDSDGRVEEVRDGQNNVLVSIGYESPTKRLVTQQGVAMQHTYDDRNTLISTTLLCQDGTMNRCPASHSTGYDGNFKPNGTADPNGNPTSLSWNAGGSNLESVTNPLQQTTEFEYDEHNNLIEITNADETPTSHTYNFPQLPTFRTSTTNGTGQTTTYVPTYNTTQNGVLVPNGLLLSQTDPSGLVMAYEYNEYGQVTKVTQAGQVTTYWYDGLGRVSAMAQTGGIQSHTTLNIYDSASRLRGTVQNWDGTTPGATLLTTCTSLPATRTSNVCTFYEYDAAGRTTKVIDARGRANLTFYDSAGRTYLTIQNYNGANDTNPLALCNWANPHATNNLCQRTEYDNFGRVIKTTDPLGRVTRTEYDSLGRVKGTIQNSVAVTQLSQCSFPPAHRDYADRDLCTLYTYDLAGNLLITQDPVGRLTRTFYDELNRVVGQVQNWTANGPIQTFANLQSSCFGLRSNRTSNICTATTYDNVGNAIIHTDPMGRQTRTFYDEVGRVQTVIQNWQTGFDPVNCAYNPNNMATANLCTSYGYDAFGRQIIITNALNQTSLTVYDAQSRPFISVANWDRATAITNEAHCSFAAGARSSNICTVTYYDALGRRAATKNGLGQMTTYGYDALGRQTNTTRLLSGTSITTSTQLDVLGNRLSSTDARNHTTTYSYDTLNRLTSTTSPMGVEQTQQYNAAGWVLASLNGVELATLYEYDLFGRLLTTTDPLNHTTTIAYDHLGNQTRQTDALNIATSYQYDALNRLVGVKENDTGGAPTHQSNVLTQYSYDILGNRTGITNAHGKFSEVVYDVLGRPVTVTNALQQQTTYTYDALGKVRQMVDGNGAITTYSYDGLNRLTSTTYVQDNETVSHTYDALGNRLTLSDNTGVTNYTYDSLNRLTNISRGMSITSYGYDHNGNRTSLTYPDGKSVTYTYDADNRLTHVLGWGAQQASYTYDKLGRLYTTTLPNGVVTTHSYDNANRLTQIKHQNSQLLTSYTYTLNPVGNRTQVVEAQTINGLEGVPTTIHYTYDPLHRLTHASYGGIVPEYQYTYDAVGNITQSTENSVTTAKTYNDANQLVSSTSAGQTTTYTYNGAGNLTQTQVGAGTVTYYSYNQRNLLLSQATSPSLMGLIKLNATFIYDGNGDRVQEMGYSNGQLASTTTYTNDPVGLTQVLVANKNGQLTHNLWGLDLLAQDDGQAQKLTLLTDALGSVRGQMRGTTLQASTSYGPYGSIHQQTGTSQTNYGYTGEQFHAGTGLLYLRARYYSPALHAFTARDPWTGSIKRPSSLNGYNYVEGNPILHVDPSGFCAGLPSDPPVCLTGSYDSSTIRTVASQGAKYHPPAPHDVISIPLSERSTINQLAPIAFDVAKFHNRPQQTNMDNTSFAALILTILHFEGRLAGNAKPNTLYEFLHDGGADIATQFGYNGTVGIANMRPSVAAEIQEGIVEDHLGNRIDGSFCYEIRGSSYSAFLNPSWRYQGVRQTYNTPHNLFMAELQDSKLAIEYLAANLARGTDRIQALGYEASTFNLATYHGDGVQTPIEYNVIANPYEVFSYGYQVTDTLPQLLAFMVNVPGANVGGYYLDYTQADLEFMAIYLR